MFSYIEVVKVIDTAADRIKEFLSTMKIIKLDDDQIYKIGNFKKTQKDTN